MIYIVSGYRRSGTSMMMRALYTGLKTGQILYRPEQEKIGSQVENGYTPNPSGLHEVGQAYYMNATFLRGMPDGSLVKILYDGLPCLPKGNYTVFFMRRDPKEIAASCDRVDRHLRQIGVTENPMRWYPFDSFRPYRQEDIDHVLGICEARSDINLVHVDFRWTVRNPLETFRRLSTVIPIDPEKSASVVNESYYRYVSSKSRDEGTSPLGEDNGSAAQEDTSAVHGRAKEISQMLER